MRSEYREPAVRAAARVCVNNNTLTKQVTVEC